MERQETIVIVKDSDLIPWGFRISSSPGVPIVTKVRANSVSSAHLSEGTRIFKVGNRDVVNMRPEDVLDLIKHAENRLVLTIIRPQTYFKEEPLIKTASVDRNQSQPRSLQKQNNIGQPRSLQKQNTYAGTSYQPPQIKAYNPPKSAYSVEKSQAQQEPIDFENSELIQLIREEEQKKLRKGKSSFEDQSERHSINYDEFGEPNFMQSRFRSKSQTSERNPIIDNNNSQQQRNSNRWPKAQQKFSQDRSNDDYASYEDGDPEYKACYQGDNIPSKAFKTLERMIQDSPSSLRNVNCVPGAQQDMTNSLNNSHPNIHNRVAVRRIGSLARDDRKVRPTHNNQAHSASFDYSQFGEHTQHYTDF